MKKNKTIERIEQISVRINEERKQRFSLTLFFTVVVFCVLLVAVGLAAAAVYVFTVVGIIGGLNEEISLTTILISMGIISVVIGAGLSLLLAQFPLKPINKFINNMNRLAAGDFKTRLHFGKSLSNHQTFKEISESFNKLAEELENTEMLRSDFINNFSHEFKTPIVSISGLAKLINRGNLTDEQRKQYLLAIEEESRRLATMATNVLNLTKVENQSILSDVTVFNLSEQIRSCLLLLENKWTQKEIELCVEFNEYSIAANEELLKEVWINLLDNAIKFANHGGTVEVRIDKTPLRIRVDVCNTGSEISEEDQKKIFNKFYQADQSHTAQGNGVGLAVVKRIVELHEGEIAVKSENNTVTFTVLLPNK